MLASDVDFSQKFKITELFVDGVFAPNRRSKQKSHASIPNPLEVSGIEQESRSFNNNTTMRKRRSLIYSMSKKIDHHTEVWLLADFPFLYFPVIFSQCYSNKHVINFFKQERQNL